ncbi:MAG: hypothetical protein ACFFC6_18240 [Promethearchaeota archaeon]
MKFSKALGRALHQPLEKLAHHSIEENNINWLHIFEGLREDQIDESTFLETFFRETDHIFPRKMKTGD